MARDGMRRPPKCPLGLRPEAVEGKQEWTTNKEEGMMKDLVGKTAVVTGAASGIGLGIATALAQAGVKVMLCDIEEAALKTALAGLKKTNADVDSVRADVSLKAELQAAADATIARYGKVHILVNNAGVGGGGGDLDRCELELDD